MLGKRVRKCRFFFQNVFDQSKANRYSNGLTYLKSRVTIKQKHAIDSQKPKRTEHKHNTK